jgi:hypothetical protein
VSTHPTTRGLACDVLLICLPTREDVLIPFMLDPRLDPDTLFWVFEPDFRFFRQGRTRSAGSFIVVSSLWKSLPPTQHNKLPSLPPAAKGEKVARERVEKVARERVEYQRGSVRGCGAPTTS